MSIAHTDKPDPKTLPARDFRTWPGAALAIFPAGENLDPNRNFSPPRRGIRGKITTLSAGARRRIKETLSKIRRVPAFTMALTLPEECAHLAPDFVHRAFLKLSRNFTATATWDHVGLIYKREFQKNGRLHYHFVAYGLRDQSQAQCLQWWMTIRWVRMILREFPGDSDVRNKMINVHMHPKNMERVRKSIASYFSKYLGKDLDAPAIHVPGKWWGILNGDAIPFVDEKSLPLPAKVRDFSRRMASKLQGKRVQYALFKSAMTKAKLTLPSGDPLMTLQEFHRARDFKPPPDWQTSQLSPSINRLCCHYEMRQFLIASGYRQGRHNHPRASRWGRISLVGYDAPSTAERIIRHAAAMWKDWKVDNPF